MNSILFCEKYLTIFFQLLLASLFSLSICWSIDSDSRNTVNFTFENEMKVSPQVPSKIGLLKQTRPRGDRRLPGFIEVILSFAFRPFSLVVPYKDLKK